MGAASSILVLNIALINPNIDIVTKSNDNADSEGYEELVPLKKDNRMGRPIIKAVRRFRLVVFPSVHTP